MIVIRIYIAVNICNDLPAARCFMILTIVGVFEMVIVVVSIKVSSSYFWVANTAGSVGISNLLNLFIYEPF